jgi:dCMP deaminase
MEIVSFDKYFISMCFLVAMRSKDESTHIGAVIVDSKNRIRSCGYNSFVRGINDNVSERQERPEKYYWFEHAERNSIYNAPISVEGCRMYTSGIPCADCCRGIVQAGIVEVIYWKGWDDTNSDLWIEHAKRSLQMFEEAGVKVRAYDGDIITKITCFKQGQFIEL